MTGSHNPHLTIAAAVNNERVLQQNLAASPCLRDGLVLLHCERQAPSAAVAYNRAIDACDTPYVACVHQDVYLPDGWMTRVLRSLAWLSDADPKWAVAGVIGVNAAGTLLGRCWSNGLGREIAGTSQSLPAPIASLDEIVLIIRVESGIRFDESLPGFHLYGTDITQQALRTNRHAYVIDAPVIHNSLPITSLDESFRTCYRVMQQKWKPYLPLPSCVVPVTRSPFAFWRQRFRLLRKSMLGGRTRQMRHEAPRQMAAQLNYEQPAPMRRAA